MPSGSQRGLRATLRYDPLSRKSASRPEVNPNDALMKINKVLMLTRMLLVANLASTRCSKRTLRND